MQYANVNDAKGCLCDQNELQWQKQQKKQVGAQAWHVWSWWSQITGNTQCEERGAQGLSQQWTKWERCEGRHSIRTPDYPYRGQITIQTPRGPEGPGGQLIIRTNCLLKSWRPVESSRHWPTWLKEVRSTSRHWPVRVMEARLSHGHHGVLVEWLAMLQSSGYVMIRSGVRFSLGSVLFHKIWSQSWQYCRR